MKLLKRRQFINHQAFLHRILSAMTRENGGTVTPRSRGNDEAVHPLSHLTVLPHELCCAIMHHIGDTMSIVAVTATCKPLMAMADSDFWRVRLTERYPGAEPSGYPCSPRRMNALAFAVFLK